MRSRLSLAVGAAALAVGSLLAIPGTAHASYPTSPFGNKTPGGEHSGGFIWYNRSVGVQGRVQSYCESGGSVRVAFEFYTGYSGGGTKVGKTETRTTPECTSRSYNFTQDGSAYSGGIRSVRVTQCSFLSVGTVCDSGTLYNR